MQPLIRYWIQFEFGEAPYHYASYMSLRGGCGVTAYDLADALVVLREKLFKTDPIPRIKTVCENIDVSTLDPGHILPNIGITVDRGVWFPDLG